MWHGICFKDFSCSFEPIHLLIAHCSSINIVEDLKPICTKFNTNMNCVAHCFTLQTWSTQFDVLLLNYPNLGSLFYSRNFPKLRTRDYLILIVFKTWEIRTKSKNHPIPFHLLLVSFDGKNLVLAYTCRIFMKKMAHICNILRKKFQVAI
jgi:hypothetical protein